jgi:hypothetical protein
MDMQDYTLSLALFDFFPVALSATGLLLLVFTLRKHSSGLKPAMWKLAACGAGLVVTGGILKASWKLLWVTTRVDHAWMSAGLFWCLAPGFVLLAGATLGLLRQSTTGVANLLFPVAVAAAGCAVALAIPERSSMVLLLLLVLGNLVMMISLITFSSRQRQHYAAVFLAISVLATFTLSGLARIPEQTASLQWIEEIVNFVGQGLFAAAMYLLWKHTTQTQEKVIHD